MVRVTLSSIVPSGLPTDGWVVGYRVKGTTGAYLIAVGSPFMSMPIIFTTSDVAGTLYEGYIKRDCDYSQSIVFNWADTCNCTTAGYTPNVDAISCGKTTTVPATVTNSGYCLARSGNAIYTSYGSRIYNLGFDESNILTAYGYTGAYIYGNMSNSYWTNTSSSEFVGPMNREGVWIDSNCDGNKDPLTAGVQTTISTSYNNIGAARTIFLGIGADNNFKVVVNGTVIVDTGSGYTSDLQFKVWHILPIVIQPGLNYFNVIATGDGTINDAVSMVLYDNTAAQLYTAMSDADLSIIFRSSNLRGSTYDVSTCPAGYSLDTSGGSGAYMCTKKDIKPCNTAT